MLKKAWTKWHKMTILVSLRKYFRIGPIIFNLWSRVAVPGTRCENDYWITTNIFLISTRDLSIIQTINVYNQSFSTCFLETFGNYDFFVFEDEYFTVKKCVCVRVSFMFFIFCVSAFLSACYIIMLSSLDNFNILDVQYDDAIIVFIQKKCVQYPSRMTLQH